MSLVCAPAQLSKLSVNSASICVCTEKRHALMDSTFEGELEKLWLESGFISRSSLDVFSRKFDQLLREFRELIQLDEMSDAKDGVNITFVAAHRPWILPVFKQD